MAIVAERFVERLGVVRIKYKNDDPTKEVPDPVDLFEMQARGLPEDIGKKDKFSTLQAIFDCVVCDCELKSIKTLRAHCKGRPHKQAEIKSRPRPVKKQPIDDTDDVKAPGLLKTEENWPPRPGRAGGTRFDNRDHEHYPRHPPPPEVSLAEMLRGCAAPIVGLDKVKEVQSESRRVLLYVCTICRSAAGSNPSVGNADFMLDHLTSKGHMRGYFEFEYDIKNEALARILSSPESIVVEAKREEEAKAGGRVKMLESMARQELDEKEYEEYRREAIDAEAALESSDDMRKKWCSGGGRKRRSPSSSSSNPRDLSPVDGKRPRVEEEEESAAAMFLPPRLMATVRKREEYDPDIVDLDVMEQEASTQGPPTDAGHRFAIDAIAAIDLKPLPSGIPRLPQRIPSDSPLPVSNESREPMKLLTPKFEPEIPTTPASTGAKATRAPPPSSSEGDSSAAATRARLKAFKMEIADFVKRLLNGYFYGSHGYPRKIESKEEFAELARAFSRDFREEEVAKLGEEAESGELKFTDEMRARLQDKVADTMESRPTLQPS